MNNAGLQFEKLEANLERLRGRMPDLPATGVMLSRLLMHLGRSMSAMLDNEIRPFGLAEPEFRVLTTLFSQPEGVAHPSDLCAKTSQSPANMSRISDALVARDLITRVSSLHDRRKMVLHITEQGEALVRDLLPRLYGPLKELLSDFAEDEQQRLIGQLKRLCEALETTVVQDNPERGE
jgi:MarR family transcriptional repressor of emrRAB